MHAFTLAEFDWSVLFSPYALVFLVGGLIAIVSIIAPQVASVCRTRATIRLKMDMIERGMSAEEIERVINAGAEAENQEADAAEQEESVNVGQAT